MKIYPQNSCIAVAMSGGVDSSVAAALLVQQGYQVIGFTMKLFDQQSASWHDPGYRGCCSLDAMHRAQSVCEMLNIPHYSLNMIDDFKHYVIDDFVSEYISGRTPNPCVRCNTHLKWGALFDKASVLGCKGLATGHYARLVEADGGIQLRRAADPAKDQTYALWGIPRDRLPRSLFPLGDLTKAQVRHVASQLGLKTATTPESQEICFIPDNNYAAFLKLQEPALVQSLEPGELIEESEGGDRRVGTHPGFPFYTIGQRRGLGGGFNEPRFVLRTDPQANRVFIGRRAQLKRDCFTADDVNWLIPASDVPLRAAVQIRYRSRPIAGTLSVSGEAICVKLDEAAEAITPGQSAAFFIDDKLIGGGRIREVLPA